MDDEYLDYLVESGRLVDELHERLLPLDSLAIGPDGQSARLLPYRRRATVGEPVEYAVHVRTPFGWEATARVRPVLPLGWRTPESELTLTLGPGEESSVRFTGIPASAGRRQRIAIDVTIGDLLLGQHAEAFLDVYEPAT